MKQLLFNRLQAVMTVLLSSVLLFSCSQVETFETPDLSEAQERIAVNLRTSSSGNENFRVDPEVDACAIKHVDLVVGNDTVKDADGNEIGEVSVYRDNEFAYVTLSILDREDNKGDNGWFILKADVFVGAISDLGIKKNPAPGKFDNKIVAKDDGTGEKDVTFKYPIGDFTNLGSLDYAVHADLVRVTLNDDGDVVIVGGMANPEQWEGAWGRGTKFVDKEKGNGGSWAMHFSHDISATCATCNDTWSKLTGEITRAEFGPNNQNEYTMDENTDEYSVPVNGLDGMTYGVFTVRHRKTTNQHDKKVDYKFELDSNLPENVLVKSVEFMFSESSFTFDSVEEDPTGVIISTLDFNAKSTTDWVLVGSSTNSDNAIYAAFKVKFSGVCPN